MTKSTRRKSRYSTLVRGWSWRTTPERLQKAERLAERLGISKTEFLENAIDNYKGETMDNRSWDKNTMLDNWDITVNMMDDEVRDAVHMESAPTTDSEFIDEYCKRHLEKFGEEFEVM